MGSEEAESFSPQQYKTLFIIIAFESCLAIFANFFIIFTYYRFKELRKRSHEMVLILSICTILSNATYLLVPDQDNVNDAECAFNGFVLNLFGMGTIFWTTWIAWCLYCAIVLQKSSPTLLLMFSVTWGVSLLLSSLPLFTNSYGRVGVVCWISPNTTAGLAFRFLCWYLPLWIAFSINLYLYRKVSKTLRNFAILSELSIESSISKKNKEDEEELPYSKKLIYMANHLRWYPLIFVVSWLPKTLQLIIEAINPKLDKSFTFGLIHVTLHGVFYQSIGNVMVYGLNDKVREKWTLLLENIKTKQSLYPLFKFEDVSNQPENDIDITKQPKVENL
mmetsp:Transcript_47385/g.60857  ORF Transcript_47385/g.60857 Transcript_47385/m.60857 type:complete len:334 (+) Transcript_47385:14-1015(+)